MTVDVTVKTVEPTPTAVVTAVTTWAEKLLAHAEDALDVEVIRQRLADDRPWLSEDELDAALRRAAEGASGQKSA